MVDIKGIETLLDIADDLLAQAETDMSPLWRGEVENWRIEKAAWLEGFKRHQEERKTEESPEKRLTALEYGVAGLTQAVMLLQTLALTNQVQPAQGGPTRWQIAQDLDPDAEVELLDGSKVKVKDVPLDPQTGEPDEDWAMEHCPCRTHEAKRRAKAAAEGGPAKTGQYL